MLYPHVVNNVIRRHINIPTYSTSAENVYMNEYVQGTPMYAEPYMYNQQQMYYQGMMYNQNQYQGNVGTENMMQQQMQNQMQNQMNNQTMFNQVNPFMR